MKFSCALIVTCAVLLVAAVAGCGGGGSSGDPTIRGGATGPSRERTRSSYIEEAEALCRSLKKKATPIHKKFAELHGLIMGKAQKAKAITALKEYVALGREEAIDLRELGTPPVDARIVSRWTAVAKEGLDKLEEAREALEEGEDSKFEDQYKEGIKLLYKSHRIANNHGPLICGEEEGRPT
ncbi:MAG: hypothetical protein JSU06_05510 [Actinobacteria bacterium]|nr:hypothetical protein [Actinomycetota bacterium]